ncbi:MAG TPA: SDR family oxidoreductase [Casimicrobiaceae bacterium]|jgi:NAD(P)-dependent dehydrogenase (short-subunit alcohol dehydrogenase family)
MTLAGRHALVTGASRGIGAAVAAGLAATGARLTLLARDATRLQALAAGLRASGAEVQHVIADVTDGDQVDSAFATARAAFGPLDVLINNAGAARAASFVRTDMTLWAEMLEVNLTAAYRCTQAAVPDMLARKWGRVVNVASTAGLRGDPYVSAYTAAKHGLVGLTRALAAEFAPSGITVNAVCPGYTETNLLDETLANVRRATGRSEADARAALLAQARQSRFVRPEEVARAVVALCDPGSSANGEAIEILGEGP